jgi:hypothetical protein
VASFAARLRRAAEREDERRQRRPANDNAFTPAAVLHAGQARACASLVSTLVICAARRWGKSVAACYKAYAVARATPGVTCCLIGATQGSISRIFWRTLRDMSRDYRLGAVFLKGVEGWTATLPNGSQIVLLPVDSVEAADKVRGLSKVAFVCVDEAQRYKKDVLDYLLLDVIKAMFVDIRVKGGSAQMWLMGTPNPLGKLGTLWDYMQRAGTEVHHGTTYDNTKLGAREEIERVVDEMLAEEGQTRESVWYRREILAEWVVDISRRVYVFDDEGNVYDELPELTTYAFIGDIGVRDADAIAVVGWRDNDPHLYLVLEVIRRGLDTLDLADEVRKLAKVYAPILIAFDAGGLGLKTLLTIKKLFPGIPVRAVTKPAVNLQVKALNDRAKRGLKVSRKSQFYAEVRNSEWEDGIVNGKIRETGHSDIVPAMRYAALELARLLPNAPVPQTQAEKELEEQIANVERAERNRRLQSGIKDYDPKEFEDDVTSDLYDD